jgi:hypothetical protein
LDLSKFPRGKLSTDVLQALFYQRCGLLKTFGMGAKTGEITRRTAIALQKIGVIFHGCPGLFADPASGEVVCGNSRALEGLQARHIFAACSD